MSAQAWPTARTEVDPGRYCPTHHVALLIVQATRRAPDGLWCPHDHAPRSWDAVHVRGRVVMRATSHGTAPTQRSTPTPVALYGYACACTRCGRAWVSPCGCESAVEHSGSCRWTAPGQCPGGHRNWQVPKR